MEISTFREAYEIIGRLKIRNETLQQRQSNITKFHNE